ncbi:MAG: hypothetical protein QOF08_2237, partial [Gaiellales bacterium]|nr:hypothetical protein [Gaiellales bacterium]
MCPKRPTSVAASAVRAAHVEQPLVPWNGPAGERRGPARALALLSAPDVLEALDAAVIVRSPEGEIEYWNRGAERLYGWTAEEAIGHAGIGFLVAEGEEQRFAELVAQVNQHGSAEGELRLRRKDGSTFAGHFRTAGVQDADGRLIAVVGVTLDVSRRVEAGEALVAGETRLREAERARGESESLFRKGFDDAPIGMAIERPSDGRYLRVNDALCRMVGRTRDALLELTSDEITHPDDLSLSSDARGEVTGGGCFRDLQKRYARPDGTLVWASVHGSGVEDASGAVTRLFSQIVDIGDQKAREAQLDAAVADAGWLSRIRDALDEDRLVLFAQPIVDLSSGETVQRELLIRMRERDGTFVSPGEFLPAAERYGLIGEIDTWVIGQAAALAAGGTPVEINLSGLSIGDPAILAAVERALEESGADPKLLVFEVTETAVASDLDAGRAFAEQLKALGCGFALDDFGTGFGGLTYLKHLPADTLKIDIDFVRDLLTSEPDQRLVRAIVDLAHGFGQTTIAEGVEDEQTLQRLREMGVDRAQGYFLGRPGPL